MATRHPVAANEQLDPILMRSRSEYEEMPGLCLTTGQAQRLWGLDQRTCEAIFTALVASGFLRSTPRGYVRA